MIIFSIVTLFISWKWFLVLFIFVPSLFISFSFLNNAVPIEKIDGNYKIVQVISSGYIIKHENKKVLLKSKNTFNIDDLINVKTTNINSLNSKKESYNVYLKSLGIKYIANNAIILKANNKTSIRAKIINYLLTGPDLYVKYISLILIGKKNDLNKDLYEKVKYISILHLFVISGFHINLLMMIFLWIFKKIKIKNIYANLMGFIIIALYLYILNFPISSMRALFFIVICFINKEFFKNKFSKIDILSFIMLMMFLSQPYIIFSLSFIFTFTITFGILFVNNAKNKKIKIPLIILFSYLSSIGISIQVNGWFNVFGIINSIIFSPIIIINYVISIFGFPFKTSLNQYYIFVDQIINLFHNNSFIVKFNIENDFLYGYYLSLFIILSIIKHYSLVRSISSKSFKGNVMVRGH